MKCFCTFLILENAKARAAVRFARIANSIDSILPGNRPATRLQGSILKRRSLSIITKSRLRKKASYKHCVVSEMDILEMSTT